MSALANRMKGIAPSAQVTDILSGNFSVPSRGKGALVGGKLVVVRSSGSTQFTSRGGVVAGGQLIFYGKNNSDYVCLVAVSDDSNNTLNWQRDVVQSNVDLPYSGGIVAGSSYVYVQYGSGTYNYGHSVSTSGTGSYRGRNDNTNGHGSAQGLATTGNTYFYVGSWYTSGQTHANINKFQMSNGISVWDKYATDTTGSTFAYTASIVSSPSGYVYWGIRQQGNSYPSAGNAANIVKLDASGTEQWKYCYYGPNNDYDWKPRSMASDSSDRIYFGMNAGYVVALDTSGNIRWQTKIGSYEVMHMYCDTSTGYLYMVHNNSDGLITVLDASGNLVGRRVLARSGGTVTIRQMHIDGNWMYAFGTYASTTTGNSEVSFCLKMPKDLTGVDNETTVDGQTWSYTASTTALGTGEITKATARVSVSASIPYSYGTQSVTTVSNFSVLGTGNL